MTNARNTILITAALLMAIGLVMVYSASSVRSHHFHDDQTYIPRKHLLYLTLSVAGLLAFTLIDYRSLKKAAVPILIATVVLLGAVLVPGVGSKVNGAQRWFRFGSISFQPSEMAKFAAVLFIAAFATRKPGIVRDFKRGFLPITLVLGALALLIVAERDAGTPLFLLFTSALVLVAAGARYNHFAPFAGLVGVALAIPIAIGVATQNWTHISSRLGVYLHAVQYGEVADPTGSGYQINQSIIALGSGEVFGKGLGRSMQKLWYLPEEHTDFVFAILGEETGFAGTLLVVVTFATFTLAGLQIAKLTRDDPFASVLAYGITVMLALQAAANIAVVTHLVPTKGISLPFISKGGSALLFQCCAVGILINIANRALEKNGPTTQTIG